MFLKILQNPQENTCIRFFFLRKLQGDFIKQEVLDCCFPENFVKFKNKFLQNTYSEHSFTCSKLKMETGWNKVEQGVLWCLFY